MSSSGIAPARRSARRACATCASPTSAFACRRRSSRCASRCSRSSSSSRSSRSSAAAELGIDEEGVPFHVKKEVTSALRRLAPIGLSTDIIWTANARTLRHVIEMRTAPGAEEELRLVFDRDRADHAGRGARPVSGLRRQDDGSWVPEHRKVEPNAAQGHRPRRRGRWSFSRDCARRRKPCGVRSGIHRARAPRAEREEHATQPQHDQRRALSHRHALAAAADFDRAEVRDGLAEQRLA